MTIKSTPSASYSFTLRIKILNVPGMLAKVTGIIGKLKGEYLCTGVYWHKASSKR